ncbi:hypothetical protein DFH06DRAFT_1295787 [Mycena polygramma]|nr:hypothetical protein DFH06DRAFT_1295787 [Mycena polygramma]
MDAPPSAASSPALHLPVFPYPAAVKIGPSGVPEATSSSFPAINAQNQRTCRQCGVPGRYKEGKCVEKWGPGPLGPGTVCDRCRKKMKRVERRGTLEQQQSQPASGAATPASATSTSFQARSMHPAVLQNHHELSVHRQRVKKNCWAIGMVFPALGGIIFSAGWKPGRWLARHGRVIQNRVTPAVHGHAPPLQTYSPIDGEDREEEGDSLDAEAEAEVDEIEEEFVQAVHHGNPHDAEGGEDGEADRDGVVGSDGWDVEIHPRPPFDSTLTLSVYHVNMDPPCNFTIVPPSSRPVQGKHPEVASTLLVPQLIFVATLRITDPFSRACNRDIPPDHKGEGDPEADLLEAVEAAEKGSAN